LFFNDTSRTRCAIEAVLTLYDGGQVLLPKDLREKLGLKAGDKLVAISCCRRRNLLYYINTGKKAS